MTDLLPRNYTVRPPIETDAGAIVQLIAACQRAEGDRPDMTVDELLKNWTDISLEEEAILVLDPDGHAVAYADLLNRRYVRINVYAYVPPSPHEQPIWSSIISWGEKWAQAHRHLSPEQSGLSIHYFRHASAHTSHAALQAAEYNHVRTHYVMVATLAEQPPAPVWPEGIRVRAYLPGQDDHAIFRAGEESFQDIWNRPASTLERWLAPTRSSNFDPSLWFWAENVADGEPVAVCLCSVLAGRGEVDQLGVRRPWRRQGLGLALLHHAFGEFWKRDVRQVRLNVDAQSSTGAPRLYTRAGFQVAKRYLRYVKELE